MDDDWVHCLSNELPDVVERVSWCLDNDEAPLLPDLLIIAKAYIADRKKHESKGGE